MKKKCMCSGWGWRLALCALGTLYAYGWTKRARARQPSVTAIDLPELSDAYARVTNLPQFRLLRWWVTRRAVVGRVGAKVLDVGSGAGQLAVLLAQQPEVAEATGIDLSLPLIEKAREAAEMAGANATFFEVDAAEMPFPDGAFDVVVSTLSLHHWTDPLAVLRHIDRVLAPGGQAFIVDLRRDASPLVLGMAGIAANYIVPEQLRQTGEPIASFQAAYTPCEAVLLAAKSGWDDPQCVTGPFWNVLEYRKAGEK